MSAKKKTVGVIGLGPAGLAMVKELKADGGFGEVIGFDRCSRVGGRWSLDRDTHNAGIWKELCTNTSRRHSEFSDFPWDAEDGYDGHEKAYAGIYPHCTEVLAYLEAYARKFDLYPSLRLETEVKSIEKVESGWKVVTIGSKNDVVTTHDFDAIVVCNGAQAKPYHPLESKLTDFSGDVIHAQLFRSEQDFIDKRVLVIGSNVSGSEIASILAEGLNNGGCQKVVHSVRKMPYHIQKLAKGNNWSYDDLFYNRSAVWTNRVLPDWVVAKGMKSVILSLWPDQCDANTPNCAIRVSPDIRQCGIAVSKNYVDQVKNGKLPVKPEVASVDGNNVTFVDGTTEKLDAIVCATGYDFDLSFLPKSIQKEVGIPNPATGKTVMALYKNTLVPNPELVGNLAFCGLVNSVGPYFPQGEMQARYISAIWSGRTPCPDLSRLRSNAEASIAKKMDKSSILNQYDVSTSLNEDIGDELGVTPSFTTDFLNPKKYLLGPVLSCFYRSNPNAPGGDKAVAEKSMKRFDRLVASSPQVGQI